MKLRKYQQKKLAAMAKESGKSIEMLVRGILDLYFEKESTAIIDQFGNRYSSIRAAADELVFDRSAIQQVLRGKRKHCYGYVFRKV